MEKFVKGFLKFRTEVFGAKKALFTRLSETQVPRALFITCSDSRIDTTLLTQTDPGELFILRNAGNMVPPYGHKQGAAPPLSNTRWQCSRFPISSSADIRIAGL
jgi:carbonic anhydrase